MQNIKQFSRTEALIGETALEKLANAHIAIFGLGGVGGIATEALARSGVKRLTIIDKDVVCETNINRQIIASHETIGRAKTLVLKERIACINPYCEVREVFGFYGIEPLDINFSDFDYCLDAVDNITAKIKIIINSISAKVPVISCMGTGNRIDACKLIIQDIYETQNCPLAKIMRKELRRRGVSSLKVVASTEKPFKINISEDPKKRAPASMMFVPATAGLIMASEVTRYLTLES